MRTINESVAIIKEMDEQSAITANGLCSNTSSSLFCIPLPVTITTTGIFALFDVVLKVI